jgi:hypothetical protein
MKSLKKLLTVVLILSLVSVCLPNLAFADQHPVFAKAEITTHKPEILSTPEEDIPTIKAKKSSGWTWLILLGLAGGLAAVAGGGGGGGSSSGGGGDSGDVTVTW